MALNEALLKADIKKGFTNIMNQADDKREAALESLAGDLAAAFIKAIKSAEVIYVTGLVAPPSGGPVTGKLTHTIQ